MTPLIVTAGAQSRRAGNSCRVADELRVSQQEQGKAAEEQQQQGSRHQSDLPAALVPDLLSSRHRIDSTRPDPDRPAKQTGTFGISRADRIGPVKGISRPGARWTVG